MERGKFIIIWPILVNNNSRNIIGNLWTLHHSFIFQSILIWLHLLTLNDKTINMLYSYVGALNVITL